MEPLLSNHIYKIKNSNKYAAVSDAYLRDIRQYAAEYQCLSAVPGDRYIKAMVFEIINHHLYALKEDGREIALPVNQLEFDSGDFRLTA